MSFIVAAGIAAGGAIAGGLISSSAAKNAANTQAQAAKDSTQAQLDMFNKQVELNAPFRQTGLAANNKLAFLLGLNGSQPGSTPQATPMLSQGSDGVFSPTPEIQSAPGQAQPFNEQAYLAANTDVARYIAAHPPGTPGATTALEHWQNFGQKEGRAMAPPPQGAAETPENTWRRLAGQFADANGNINTDALNQAVQAAQQQQTQQASQQPGQGGQPQANGLTGFGSLTQPFSQADYAADGAPKSGPFNQAVPQAQQFAQYGGSQQVGQYGGAQQIGAFQGTPQVGNYQGAQNLDGFTDMPAFSAADMYADPGYEARLNEGLKAVNNSAAAKGGLLSGAAVKAADRFSQDYASNEYGNAFNRYQTTRGNKLQDFLTNRDTSQLNNQNALTTYTTNRQTAQQNADNSLRDYSTNRDSTQINNTNNLATYNANANTTNLNNSNNRQDYATNLATNQQNYANQNTAYTNNLNQFSLNRNNALQDYDAAYQRFQQNRSNVINPLLSLMGYGQQATGATSNAAANYGNQSAAAIQAAGNASAAGQVGSANALNGAFTGAAGAYGNNQLMNLLLSRNGGAGVPPPANPNYGVSPSYGSAFSGFE